jgi:hypothetical protein
MESIERKNHHRFDFSAKKGEIVQVGMTRQSLLQSADWKPTCIATAKLNLQRDDGLATFKTRLPLQAPIRPR